MDVKILQSFLLPILLLSFFVLSFSQSQKAYIVVLSENTFPSNQNGNQFLSKDQTSGSVLIEKHDDILASIVTKSSGKKPRKLYSYFSAINAFAAILTQGQANQIARHSEVANVYPDAKLKKHTTHSYKFLGLDRAKNGPWFKTNGTDVIIGIIDDGIWPESLSFKPIGLGPVPKKFKGICQTGQNFTKSHCNRKIVGARYFISGFLAQNEFASSLSDYLSPRSAYGHGVHTSGIAGGSVVKNVNVGGFNFGSAKGVAHSSRIAAYKVCWGDASSGGCYTSDVINGIDHAVRDKVDVISMSLGYSPLELYKDVIAKAVLGSVLANIPFVLSAGNGGSDYGMVGNVAPWGLNVAASSMDRSFSNSVTLGNGKTFSGNAITRGLIQKKNVSLVFGYDEAIIGSESCTTSLNSQKVKNKIVYCRALETDMVESQSEVVYEAGGLGMIVTNLEYSNGEERLPQVDFFQVPSSQVDSSAGEVIEKYALSSKSASARITPSTIRVGSKSVEAPVMDPGSSKGPNSISGRILKPDITAPGMNVLAAWPEDKRSPVLPFGKTAKFKFLSGTSMACPHVAGAIALLKAFHPRWPVSWLYSAVRTTAYTKTNRNNPIRDGYGQIASPLNYGAGHLDVNRALFPGLIYAWESPDLYLFKCLAAGSLPNPKCKTAIQEIDLNLPSLSLSSLCKTTTVKRRVTHVDVKPSTYRVVVASPEGTVVTVSPKILLFKNYNHTLEYKITVKPVTPYDTLTLDYSSSQFTYGYVKWYKKKRSVKLTVAVNVPSNC